MKSIIVRSYDNQQAFERDANRKAKEGYEVRGVTQATKNDPMANLAKNLLVPGGTLLWGSSRKGGRITVTYALIDANTRKQNNDALIEEQIQKQKEYEEQRVNAWLEQEIKKEQREKRTADLAAKKKERQDALRTAVGLDAQASSWALAEAQVKARSAAGQVAGAIIVGCLFGLLGIALLSPLPTAAIAACPAKPASMSHCAGSRSKRSWTWVTIGGACAMALPTLVASTPTMT